MLVGVKRVYEAEGPADRERILVDRLWPRGVSKESHKFDKWLKNAAPSDALRKWFGHDPKKWGEFKKRYRKELMKSGALDELAKLVKKQGITLVYAAKDTEHNNAVALAEFLKE